VEEYPEEPSLHIFHLVVCFSGPQVLIIGGNAVLSLAELCADLGWQFLFTPLIQGKMHVQRFKLVLVMPPKVSNPAVEDRIPFPWDALIKYV